MVDTEVGSDLDNYQVLTRFLDIFLASEDAQDLCKRFVFSDLFANLVRGASVFTLNSQSNLSLAASFGTPVMEGRNEISAWDETPASKCIRDKVQIFVSGSTTSNVEGFLFVPLLRRDIPIGNFAWVLDPKCEKSPIPPTVAPTISGLGAYFLDSKGFSSKTSSLPTGLESVNDLTDRQMTILSFMADGLTNLEISKNLILSESSVRQETIRIYRALMCANRIEAVSKARALGIIPPATSRNIAV